MSAISISEQVQAIRAATAAAASSKEAARKFLVDAGIIKPSPKPNNPKKKS